MLISGKSYSIPDQEKDRRKIWEMNLKKISHHNLQYSLGAETFTMGVNQFSDLVQDVHSSVHLKMLQTDMLIFIADPY